MALALQELRVCVHSRLISVESYVYVAIDVIYPKDNDIF